MREEIAPFPSPGRARSARRLRRFASQIDSGNDNKKRRRDVVSPPPVFGFNRILLSAYTI